MEAGAPPAFVSAVVVGPESIAAIEPKPRANGEHHDERVVVIELKASGVTVRIGDGASPAKIAAVIGAPKGAS
ncbi:hypothetical protein [Brucella intermedia]|uniref:hypothetical protein n=1 Tax=Brucella intermedia TaxID=94625 RepID=UPI0023621417|nr:hypothetical protein [Brucella intermedia]